MKGQSGQGSVYLNWIEVAVWLNKTLCSSIVALSGVLKIRQEVSNWQGLIISKITAIGNTNR